MSFMLNVMGSTLGAIVFEERILKKYLEVLYAPSDKVTTVPKAYGLVIAINVIAGGYAILHLGFKVGKARETYKAKAIEEGDKEAEERFSLPKLYAEGFSENAKLFNCVQRGHQQALETLPQFLVYSLVGGVRHPIVVSVAGLIWIIARLKWAEGYASGVPKKRYDHWISSGIWTGLLVPFGASLSTAIGFLGIL